MIVTPRVRALLHRLAVVTAPAALAISLCAQQQVPARDEPIRLDKLSVNGTRPPGIGLAQPITAASRLGLTPLETPASVAIVPGDLVRELGIDSVIDAKTLAPGITSANSPGNGGNLLNARGFTGQNSVKQLYNGIEIFNAGGVVSFPFDPWNVERIEVLSGPASVLYGTGSIGGALNVISRRPDPTRSFTEIAFGAGAFGALHEAIGTTGPLGGGLSYRADLSHRSADNWVDHAESESTAASASLRWDASDRWRFVLAADYGRQDPTHYLGTPVLNGAPVPGTSRINYNIADHDLYFQDARVTFETDGTISDSLTLHNNTYWLGHNRRYRDVTLFTYQPATATVRRTSYRDIAKSRENQGGTQTTLKSTLPLAGRPNDFLLGFELNRNTYDREDNVRGGASTVDALHPVPGLYRDAYLEESKPFYFMTVNQAALFLEDRFKVRDNLSLVTGLRADRYRTEREDLIVPATTRGDESAISGNVGVVFQPRPGLSLYGQAATASDPVNSLSSIGANQQGFALSEGRQFEVGAKQLLWHDRIEWTLAAYDLVKKDLLTPNLANPSISEQVGQQSARGLEAAISARLGAWRIDLNGTVLKPKFDEFGAQVGTTVVSLAGKVPVTVPKRAANLIVLWDFARGWTASAVVRYVGERFTNNTNTAAIPSYTILNLGLGWQVTKPFRVDVRLENATDRVYGTQGSTTQWILGRPRAWSVEGTYRF